MKSHTFWLKKHYKKYSVLILLVVLAIWFMTRYHFVEYTDYSLNPKAKKNIFYSSQLLLDYHSEEGNKTTNLNDIDLKDFLTSLPTIDKNNNNKHPTLIIKNMDTNLPDSHIKILMDWIKKGGHVILFANTSRLSTKNIDYQKIQTQLQKLQQEKADAHVIKEDAIINQHLKNILDSDQVNPLLGRLGIFYLTREKDKKVEFFNRESKEKEEASLVHLLISKNLAWVQTNNQVRLIDNSDSFGYFDSRLFLARQHSATKTIISKPVDANQIRKQLKKLQTDYLNHANSQKVNVQKNVRQTKAYKVVNKLLNMPDDELVLFFADDVYFDAYLEKGRITVLESYDLFGNPYIYKTNINRLKERTLLDSFLSDMTSIYKAQNAEFLLDLTSDSEHIWFLTKTSVMNLLALLWKHGRFSLLGLALLVFLWLWSLPNRFGKLERLIQQPAHDILRYFRQIGRFAWDTDNAQKLLVQNVQQQMQVLLTEYGLSALLNNQTNPEHWQALKTLLQKQLVLKENALKQFGLNLSEARQMITDDKLKILLKNQYVQLSDIQFVEITQTFWLVNWLLYKEH